MRIRKNAKLSPLLFFSSPFSSQSGSYPVEAFQTHVCQLNQSPWDVIPFDSNSIQFEYDSFTTANGSARDSIGVIESVASMMDIDKAKVEDMAATMMGAKELVPKNAYCNSGSNGGYNKKPAAAAAARSRAKPRAAGKKTSSSSSTNPYEFYYYSGFGPLWSKRRGDRNGGEGIRNGGENSIVAESENVITSIAPSTTDVAFGNNNDTIQGGVVVGSCLQMDNVELDYVDIDDEEDQEDGNDDKSGKKKTRKPVKARSLKSLM